MAINYTKKTWQNAPSTATPLSSANIQIMDNAIEAACDGVDELSDNLATVNTYVPTASAGTINTIAIANYVKAGKIILLSLDLNITSPATGNLTFTLPVAAISIGLVTVSDHNAKVLHANAVSGSYIYVYNLTASTSYRLVIGGSYISAT